MIMNTRMARKMAGGLINIIIMVVGVAVRWAFWSCPYLRFAY